MKRNNDRGVLACVGKAFVLKDDVWEQISYKLKCLIED